MTVRVLIADDHGVVREGLANFLALDKELEIVGMAEDGLEAITLSHQLKPDVILMDVLMPNLDGIAATSTIRQKLPDIEVLVLTSVLEGSTISRAIEAGAIGYLLKNTRAKELCQAIKAAAAHQVQLSPQAAALLVRQTKTFSIPLELSEREKDVLELVAQGLSNKEIATQLQLAENTIKTHVSSILTKLGVQSRTQAILHAVRLGLIPPPPSKT